MVKSSLKSIQEALKRDLSSCVLITCEPPSSSGEMKVELTYHGDRDLAAYLLQDAQRMLDEEVCEGDSPCSAMSLVK